MAKALTCPKCGKRMITPTILEKHLAKSHKEVVTEEEAVSPNGGGVPPEKVADAVQEKVSGEVVIHSADNRELEVAIGSQYWKGREISVPEELAGEVRRILTDGGYYLKD